VTKYVTGNSRPLHSVILLARQRRLLASEKCLSKRRRIGWNARMRDQKFAREFNERRMMENTFPASQLRISTRGWLMTAIFRGHVRRLLVSVPSPSCVTYLSLLVFLTLSPAFFFGVRFHTRAIGLREREAYRGAFQLTRYHVAAFSSSVWENVIVKYVSHMGCSSTIGL